MANALLAGVSPIVGLYALLVGTPTAALTTSSQFMTVAVTAAMAVTVGSSITAVPADQRDAAVAIVALLVGAFMALFGLLRGGRLLRFVSNAVMKGFLNGVAVLVIVGQLSNVTGYASARPYKFGKTVDTVAARGPVGPRDRPRRPGDRRHHRRPDADSARQLRDAASRSPP